MNKQALTEVLGRQDEWWDDIPDFQGDLRAILAAARLVERLLPGECEHGETTEHGAFRPGVPGSSWMCPGQVWDEGIVEVVAKAIYGVVYPDREMVKPRTIEFYKAEAVAVLSAIAQLAEAGSQ